MTRLIPFIILLFSFTAHAAEIITAPIVAQAGQTYDFTGRVLQRNSRGWMLIIPAGVNNVTVKGGEFIGGGISAARTDGTTITGVYIHDTFAGSDIGDSAAFGVGDFTNSRFVGNTIKRTPHTAVWMWGSLDRSIFSRNDIEDCGHGMHSFHRGGVTSRDVEISFNSVRKAGRHGFEFQNYGKMYRWKFLNNIAHDWKSVKWGNPAGYGHMAFSLATGQSEGPGGIVEPNMGPGPYINDDMLVEGNVALTTGDFAGLIASGQAKWYDSCAFELMGNLTFRNNFMDGWPHPVLMEFLMPGRWQFYGNTMLTAVNGPQIRPGIGHPQQSDQNNWEIIPYVGFVEPAGRYEVSFLGKSGDRPVPTNVGPGATTQPAPPPVTQPSASVRVVAYRTQVNLDWTPPLGTTGIVIERKPSNGLDGYSSLVRLGPGVTNYIDRAFAEPQIVQTWEFDYRVTFEGIGSVVIGRVQIGLRPDPVEPLPPARGVIVTTETELDSTGRVVRTTATTKPN